MRRFVARKNNQYVEAKLKHNGEEVVEVHDLPVNPPLVIVKFANGEFINAFPDEIKEYKEVDLGVEADSKELSSSEILDKTDGIYTFYEHKSLLHGTVSSRFTSNGSIFGMDPGISTTASWDDPGDYIIVEHK